MSKWIHDHKPVDLGGEDCILCSDSIKEPLSWIKLDNFSIWAEIWVHFNTTISDGSRISQTKSANLYYFFSIFTYYPLSHFFGSANDYERTIFSWPSYCDTKIVTLDGR